MKSRRKASFLTFKDSFLKEVSQKSFVSELQSFNFEGSLAEKFLCCWHLHVSPAWHLTPADRFLIAVLRSVSKTAQSVSASQLASRIVSPSDSQLVGQCVSQLVT